MFMDWFNNCFVHEVERYLRKNNLSFKVLLILDNAPGHPEALQFAHPNVEVVFLPPNTTALIQPMDQGLIAAFKRYYMRRTISGLLDALDNDPSLTLKQCWKDFNIADAITNIKDSIDEIKPSTLNACWGKLWPDVVLSFEGFPSVDVDVRRIVELARNLGGEGFEDLEVDEVEELLESHGEELTEDDLDELLKSSESDDDGDDDAVELRANFTLSSLSKIILASKNLAEMVMESDPFMERSIKFKRGMEDLMLPYKEVQKDLNKRQKQSSILRFMKPAITTTTTTTSPRKDDSPKASTSGVTVFRAFSSVSSDEGDSE